MMLARLIRVLTRFRRVQPRVGPLHAAVLRRSRGRIRRSLLLAAGQPVLALTTTGRRSGKARSTVVAYLNYADAYVIGSLNLGSDHHPAWCLNLWTDPRAWIEVNGERKAVQARQAVGEEAERLWQALIDRRPAIGNLLRLARRQVPIFVLDPVVSSAAGRPRDAAHPALT